MIILSDTSALSALAKTELLYLLPEVFGQISVTEAVWLECSSTGAPAQLRALIQECPGWLQRVADPEVVLPETNVLDPGEASSISLAWLERPNCLLIIDEKRGRAVATALGLRISGVLALIVEAVNRGRVDFDTAVIRLKSVGFRLSAAVIEQARLRINDAS